MEHLRLPVISRKPTPASARVSLKPFDRGRLPMENEKTAAELRFLLVHR
jgi:hypothetical protein